MILVEVKVTDKFIFRYSSVQILKETPKTFVVYLHENSVFRGRERTVHKADLGKVKSGILYGSFECFCLEEDREEAEGKLREAIVQYYSSQYLAAFEKMQILSEAMKITFEKVQL